MKNRLIYFLCLITPIIVLGCVKKDIPIEDTSPSQTIPVSPQLILSSADYSPWPQETQACVPNTANTLQNLEGRWLKCIKTHTNISQSEEIVISNSNFTSTLIRYNSLGCLAGTELYRIISSGQFNIVGANYSGFNGVNSISFTVNQVKIASESSSETDTLNSTFYSQGSSCGNSNGFCSINNWATGTEVDVSGLTNCPSTCSFPYNGQSLATVFAIGNIDTGDLLCSDGVKNGLVFGGNKSAKNFFLPHDLILNVVDATYSTTIRGGIFIKQ